MISKKFDKKYFNNNFVEITKEYIKLYYEGNIGRKVPSEYRFLSYIIENDYSWWEHTVFDQGVSYLSWYGFCQQGIEQSYITFFNSINLKINKDGTAEFTDTGGKTVTMSLGRFFRACFADATDKAIESLVKMVMSEFLTESLEVQVTTEIAEIFKSPTARDYGDFYTNMWQKNLANSCMRYDFDFLDYHPAEAYESGDFEIAYIKDEYGHLYARALIHKDSRTYGPIYAVCAKSLKKMQTWLFENSYAEASESSWLGAKLRYLPFEYDDESVVAMPYIDILNIYDDCYNEYLKKKGNYFYIVDCESIASDVSGCSADGYQIY